MNDKTLAGNVSVELDVNAYVQRLYSVLLGRAADRDGLVHFRDLIVSTQDPSAAVERLIGSLEYRNQARHMIYGGTVRGSLYYCNACFDPQEVMRRHALPDLQSRPDYLTNFLGVLINPDHFGTLLTACRGLVEEIPIPTNWHADMTEWGAALRAVDLARDCFTMIELGCGWGCWMNNTGVAARRAGLSVHLIGVEGDANYIGYARAATAANGFLPSQVELHRGIAAAVGGIALFPRQDRSGGNWGLEPVFGASDAQIDEAIRTGSHDAVKMIPLSDLVAAHDKIDLLHADIQGGEAALVAEALPTLTENVAYLVIGTHSRQIEGRLFDMLLGDGWRLEIERPAILTVSPDKVGVGIDGVQGWRNPRFLA